jgi:glucose-1-phosphate thymidylyltransferase
MRAAIQETLQGMGAYGERYDRSHASKLVAPGTVIAYRRGYIDAGQLERLALTMSKNSYGQYLVELLENPEHPV